LVKDVDEARKLEGTPERRADEAVRQEAEARLQADYAGERSRLLRVGQEGGQLGDVDTLVAKSIVNREGLAAVQSGDTTAIQDAMSLIDSYRRTGTEQARGFRQRRDPVETPAQRMGRTLTESLLTPPKKMQGKLDRARAADDSAEIRRIRKEWAEQVQQLREKLKSLGVDLDQMDSIAQDPILASRALRTIQTVKADAWDASYEYWNNAILSGGTTQMANILGNIGHMGWRLSGERLTQALMNTFVRSPKEAQWGEFRHILAGMLPGIQRGVRNFFKAWETEHPVLAETLGREGRRKVEEPNVSIGGTKGRVIRTPWRLLLAFDELQKSMVAQMEVGALAYRSAKARGLRGDALQADIARQVGNLESEAWQQALDSAVEGAFQAKPGRIAQSVLFGRRTIPGIRYVVPFVTTPTNIIKAGIRKTPLGAIPLAERIHHGLKTGSWDGVTARVAEQLIAWGVVLALWDNDPEEPWITGAVSETQYGPRRTSRRTFPSSSIRIRDKWYSYARLEPFATTLGLTVDWIQAFKSGDPEIMLKTPFESIVGQLKNKTFLSGIGDLLNALDSTAPAEKFARWAASFATSWVPNIVRSAGRAKQEVFPYRGIWGDGPEWRKRFLKRLVQRTELGFIRDEPHIDLWGRESPRTKSPVPQTDWLWRVMIPVRIKDDPIHPGDRLIVNWNVAHPNKRYDPHPPRKSFTYRGKTYTMDEQQYTEFLRLSGQLAASWVATASGLNVDNPGERDLAFLKKALSQGRRQAKKQLLANWPTP
jgi:hypothetical protein